MSTIPDPPSVGWLIATAGKRPDELVRAVEAIEEFSPDREPVLVVVDGGSPPAVAVDERHHIVVLSENVGAPTARNRGIEILESDVVVCLDDDAVLRSPAVDIIRQRFEGDPALAVVSFRIVDENGHSLGRHIPRVGSNGENKEGPVATFLEGACAIRRSAFRDVGGYWEDIRYPHEQLDLSWRLLDRGWTIRYEPKIVVEHPHSEVGRHAEGWYQTGRNRVLVARRNLPYWVMLPHTLIWLFAGIVLASGSPNRRAYVRGWWAGWRYRVAHRPIRFATVLTLTRLGRPPII